MKLIKYFAIIAAAVGMMSACTSDLEKIQTLPDGESVAPVLHELAETEVTITAENKSKGEFLVEWDVAYFGDGVLFATDILLSCNNAEVVIISGLGKDKTSANITYTQIHTLVSKSVEDGGLGVKADTPTDIKLRLCASVGNTGPELYSDYVTVKVSYTE